MNDMNENLLKSLFTYEQTKHNVKVPKPQLIWSMAHDGTANGVKDVIKYPADVAFLSTSYFVVADSEGHNLQLFDLDGSHISTICQDHIFPNCVATTRDNKLVVTDRKRKVIKIYDVTGECIRAWGETIMEGEDEIKLRPQGVAVNNKGQIIITDTFLNVIRVYDQQGKRLAEYCSKGKKVNQLNLPFYVTVDRRDNIIVSDNMNYCLKVFDPKGNFKVIIGSGQDWGKRKFQCPYGVGTDNYGSIIVADHDGHKVAFYSGDGQFIGDIASQKDLVGRPCGIATNYNSDLLVTENTHSYSNIRMYKMNYM